MKKHLGFFIILTQFICSSFLFAEGDNSPDIINLGENKDIPKSLFSIISVDMDNVPLEKTLLAIAEKGKFKLNFNRKNIPVYKKVSVKMDNVPAINVLKKILIATDTDFLVTKGGLFAVVPKDKKKRRRGAISGRVSESYNNRTIPGVYIQVINTKLSTISDENGKFEILNIPAGSYNIKFTAAGFKTMVKTDVIVHPGRITNVNVTLAEQFLDINETVEVMSSYFHEDEKNPSSSVNISAEEVRRAPGSGGLLDRMLPTLPGVGQRRDGSVDLMVRGGCPTENAFYIDNIEVPYISHVPNLGSTGGRFSSIHPDLVQRVDFYSGAFSSNYGGRLSSVTDITFREGNRDEFNGQVDANLILAGALIEGPISKGKGSWLISGRISYLELLESLDIIDTPIKSNDIVVKLTYDLSDKHKISFLNFTTRGIFQDDHGNNVEDRKYIQNTIGFNWKSFWNDNFFSNTTLSYSFLDRTDKKTYQPYTYEGYTGQYYWEAPDITKHFILRHSNLINFKNQNRLEFGVEIKHERENIHYYRNEYHDSGGELQPSWEHDFDYQTTKSALFLSYVSNFLNKFTAAIGFRGDYSSTHKTFHLSPRLSLSYQISQKLSINAGCGIFYQTIPMRLQTIYRRHRNLNDLKATHYILGIEYIDAGTKITLEGYYKKYENLLIDTNAPYALASEFAIDNYYYPPSLTNDGRGYARGIEFLVHKKLVKRFYGIFNVSIYRSRYKDLNGIWRRSPYENRYIVNLMAGYKPNPKWEFGLSWTIMGGRPSSPFDLEASRLYNQAISDPDISKYNTENYPAYSRLNLRVERKFYFGKINFIVFLDIWNILSTKNYEYYQWDAERNDIVPAEDQMPFMPIFGLKFEF